MLKYYDANLPVVAFCNISETFFPFLKRAAQPEERQRLIYGEQYRGDRTIVWLGNRKLVVVSFPIPHSDYLRGNFGYGAVTILHPQTPTPCLSLDILREEQLLQQMVDYAGSQRILQIVPYATTSQFLQLVGVLRKDYGLTVLLPESPAPEALWVRDYIDTKTGFRSWASQCLPDADKLLPVGFICPKPESAAEAAHWFSQRGQACILKTDDGENGIGNWILPPHTFSSARDIYEQFQGNPFLKDQCVTVEQYILAEKMVSPSLELFIPPAEQGEPEITYVSDQIFLTPGDFCGVLVSKELTQESWYPKLVESGMRIASELQQAGYVGHIDIDAIVDDHKRIYLLEANSRRTGGTHVHEFAEFALGYDYLEHYTLLSNDVLSSGNITSFDELKATLQPLLFPIANQKRGVVIMVTSALEAHEFGCIIVASSTTEVMQLQQVLIELIKKH